MHDAFERLSKRAWTEPISPDVVERFEQTKSLHHTGTSEFSKQTANVSENEAPIVFDFKQNVQAGTGPL